MLASIVSGGPYVWLPLIIVTLALLYLFGRVFASGNEKIAVSANLNLRAARIIGRRGAAMRDGADGMSRIQVDGIEWPVCSNDNAPIRQGEILEVTAFDGTTLLAKKLVA